MSWPQNRIYKHKLGVGVKKRKKEVLSVLTKKAQGQDCV